MKSSAFRGLVEGPPAYAPRTPWNAWAAAGASMLIFIVATVAAYGAAETLRMLVGLARAPAGATDGMSRPGGMKLLMVWLMSAHVVMIVLTVIAAGAFKGSQREVLAWHRPPRGGLRVYAEALALMLAMLALYNGAVYLIAPHALLADLRLFVNLLHSDAGWLAAPAIGIGAPVSEELLFRGFLLSALAASPIGFRAGAILSTAAWTTLHAGYSAYGLLEVFLVGLYLSWVLWRTGSLWVPLACHAIYNSALLLLLMVLPIKL